MSRFITSVPYPTGVTPTSLSGCSLWLDAADSTTITGTSSITAWRDKSGSNNNAIFSGTNPSFVAASNVVITANGNQNFTVPATAIQQSAGSGSLFFVYGDQQTGGSWRALWGTATPSERFYQSLQSAENSYAVNGPFTPSGTVVTALNTTNTIIYNMNYTYGSSTGDLRINGTTLSSSYQGVPSPSGALTLSGTGWGVIANVRLYEVIIYKGATALTTAQQQQIEGYLAQKWSLTARLPGGHPGLTQSLYTAPRARTLLTKQAYTGPAPTGITVNFFTYIPRYSVDTTAYYNVTTSSWTNIWQPHLQSLVTANSGATPSLSSTGASTTITSCGSGALAPNGNIYYSVGGGGSVINYYNPNSNTVSSISIGQAIDSPAAVLGADSNVYIYPINANTGQNIIKINTSTNTVSTISAGTNGWWGMILAPNGNLYGVPQRTMNNVLVLNTSTGATSTITGSANGYWGGVLAPNGKIYCVPGSSVGIIDPVAGTITSGAVSGSGQTNGYFGGVLGWDGNVYCIPTGSTVGVINTTSNTFTTIATGGSVFYSGGCLGPDGKIYCIPRNGGAIGVINITNKSFSTSSMTLPSVGNGYNGATLSPSGTIYISPYISIGNIYKITFSGLSQTPSSNYCLSAWTNKF